MRLGVAIQWLSCLLALSLATAALKAKMSRTPRGTKNTILESGITGTELGVTHTARSYFPTWEAVSLSKHSNL